MKTENSTLMKMARESLVGRWALSIGVIISYVIITTAAQNIVKSGSLIGLIIGGPFSLGLSIFVLSVSRNQDPKYKQLFDGFKEFGTALGSYLLRLMFTVLWSLLLIIPGIIASISYSMTFYIIADDKSIGPLEAIRKSKNMMYGYKMKFFLLQLRFVGWAVLSVLTLGIGFLWLIPYIEITNAKFYDDIRNNLEPVVVS